MKKTSKTKKIKKELCPNCKPSGVCKSDTPSKLSKVLSFFFNKVGSK